VANVPLIPELEPPEELEQVPAGRVIGFTARAEKLKRIRLERVRALDLDPDSSYAEASRIADELRFANRVFQRLGCPVIDVSYKAVEESAREVIELLHPKGGS
jgi:hypothetical protein